MLYNLNFDERASEVINYAFVEAKDLGHRYVGTEHILLGLCHLDSGRVVDVLNYYELTLEQLRLELIKMLGRGVHYERVEGYTPGAEQCLTLAHQYSVESESDQIIPEHIFMALLQNEYSIAYKVLHHMKFEPHSFYEGIEWIHAIKTPKKNLYKAGNDVERLVVKEMVFKPTEDLKAPKAEAKTVLEIYCEDLTAKAENRQLREIIGRDSIIKRMIQILSRSTKHSPCIVGEAGVGKTAVVEGLAQRMVSKQVPESLRGKRILMLNVGLLLSGTMYRGEFEKRMMQLIDALSRRTDIILFIDDLSSIMGAGATSNKSLDAMALFKPLLSSGTLKLIGTSNVKEYERIIDENSGFERQLQKINLDPPSDEETLSIMHGLRNFYENFHHVSIEEEAIRKALSLSKRYITNRSFPDKALDILDEACALAKYEALEKQDALSQWKSRLEELKIMHENAVLALNFKEAKVIKQEEAQLLNIVDQQRNNKVRDYRVIVDNSVVERVVALWTKIPVMELAETEREKLLKLEDLLTARIIGQDQAISVLSHAIRRGRVRLSDPDGPMGSFIFLGPTGVGKTALSKELATIIFGGDQGFIRLDMSEYMEKYAVSKIIGSPPGYEGHQSGGYLTEQIKQKPYSLILLDEIEKAHPEVMNIFLQLLDEGRLTDSKGRTVDFKNTIVIMTSNVGIDQLKKQNTVGFASTSDYDVKGYSRMVEVLTDELKKTFKPEFLNRIDDIVIFRKLEKEALKSIVDIELKPIIDNLSLRDISCEYDEEILDFLVEISYDEAYGARPLKRAIVREIEDPLATMMLEETLKSGDTIKLLYHKDEHRIEVSRRD